MHEIPLLGAPGAQPHPLMRGYHSVEREVHEAFFGQHDLVPTPEALTAAHTIQRYTSWWAFVALPAGISPAAAGPEDVLGFAGVTLYLRENTRRSTIQVGVRPRCRNTGVGDALWARTLATVRGAGRSEVEAWTFHRPVPADHPDALRTRGGALAVDGASPEARWVLARGFHLVQTDRHSVFTYPPQGGARQPVLAHLRAAQADAAGTAGPGYRTVQWRGPTPTRWVASMARLRRRMSADAPSGELDLDTAAWDEERVRAADDAADRRRLDRLITAAVDKETLELAAFTELTWDHSSTDHARQGDTFVSRRHRGRRLGTLVKANNMLLLAESLPGIARIHAHNPSEDRYLLAITDALGFEHVATWGRWVLTL